MIGILLPQVNLWELFHRVFPPKTDTDTTDERCAAFERMKNVCRYIPDLDEKSELDEYREEKYGK